MVNKLLFLKSIVISNFRKEHLPFKLSFAVTYRCNLKCSMCNIWKKKPAEEELNVGEIDGFFRKANKFSWVGITGGEPFLREELLNITDIIIGHSTRLCALHIATNGQFTEKIITLADKIHEKYKKLKIVFTVSIDGPPSLHDKIRGVHGAWNNAINTVVLLRKKGWVKPQIGFTLSGHNIDKFDETFTALKDAIPDIAFDDININIFQQSDSYYENQYMHKPDEARLLNAIRLILEQDRDKLSFNNFLRRKYLRLYFKYISVKKSPLRCKALSSSFFLDPYGNISPCPMYNKKLINVRDMKMGFSHIWFGSEASRLRYDCANGICPGCWNPCDAYSSIIGSFPRALLTK